MRGRPIPRPLVTADLAAVVAIEAAIFPDPWSRRSFAATLGRPGVRGFALDDEAGRLIGYGVGSLAADEGEILNIAVEPSARGRGAGRQLLRAMLDWLAGAGAGRVFLEVRRSNAAAIALYEGSGFRSTGVRRGYYAKPREDAVTMVLEVGLGHALE
jgi:ribosomal-protein-alanine N-acetyltransferase